MIYRQLLREAENVLRKNFLNNNVSLDVEILLAKTLNKSREHIIINQDTIVKPYQIKNFRELLKLRCKKTPIAQILGYKEFYNTKFKINKSVLIPRPETEALVDKILKILKPNDRKNILDIGTGSGCILISVLKKRLRCHGTGVDISKEAIKVAEINAKIQHLLNRIKFIHSDIDKFLGNKYDLVVSNPPYINKFKLKSLVGDVKDFEPILALDGGPNGYKQLIKVIKKSKICLKKNGSLLLEIDDNQNFMIREILKKNNFYVKEITKDHAGKFRYVSAIKK